MKELLEIRLSHLLRHCSVGAIVRGPDISMTVMDTRHWTDRNGNPAGRALRYVDRVRAALEIAEELREPPIARQEDQRKIIGVCVPARRFPNWAMCPKCGLLHYLPVLDDDARPRCREPNMTTCHGRPHLVQVPYVLVHPDGHMDELPWHNLAHLKEGKPASTKQEPSSCRKDNKKHYLRLYRKKQDSDKLWLFCARCKMETEFTPKRILYRLKNPRMRPQPWIRESVNLEQPPEIAKVNDVQVHLPKTRNALVIPPESRIRKGTVVDRLYNSTRKLRSLESCRTSLQLRTTLRGMASEFRCPLEAVEAAWRMIQEGYPLYGETFPMTQGQLLEDEYQALLRELPDVSDDEDFVTRHRTAGWRGLAPGFSAESREGRVLQGIDRLISVTRLKEILVFEGFSRCRTEKVVKPDIVGESDWLPAVELFGEGIFITLAPNAVKRWENIPEIMDRTRKFKDRFERAYPPDGEGGSLFMRDLPEVSPRLLLLHALSHLLIRQLECDCGYPAASLKERIYCACGETPMAGILVYVAVPDVVGSLGGIAEIAEPRRFLALASAALARSEWCSFDPVCLEQEGQGPHLLNRAACHACLLVPDPSCSFQNTLLDRVFVRGDRQSGIPGFFESRG